MEVYPSKDSTSLPYAGAKSREAILINRVHTDTITKITRQLTMRYVLLLFKVIKWRTRISQDSAL